MGDGVVDEAVVPRTARRRSPNRRRAGASDRRFGIVAGLLVFVLILGAGAVYVLSRPDKWTAKTTLVLLPAKGVDPGAAASYYDTLSSGQITSTASQILGLGRFKTQAAQSLGLTGAQTSATSVSSAVVTGSSIVKVTVSGPTASIAERMADAVVNDARATVNSLVAPYQLSVVSVASGSGSRTGSLNVGKFAVILVVVAAAVGLGVQQAVNQLRPLWRRRRQRMDQDDDEDMHRPVQGGGGPDTSEMPIPAAPGPLDRNAANGGAAIEEHDPPEGFGERFERRGVPNAYEELVWQDGERRWGGAAPGRVGGASERVGEDDPRPGHRP